MKNTIPAHSIQLFLLCLVGSVNLLFWGCAAVVQPSQSNSTPPMSLTTNQLPSAVVDKSYQASLSVSGGKTPYNFSIAAGSLPAGITLAPNSGMFSGIPTQTAVSSFTVQITDSSSPAQQLKKPLSIVTDPAVQPLQIMSTSLSSGQVNVSYSAVLAATGGTTPYAWSITAGSLPMGLVLDPNMGTVSGIPTQVGSLSFTVQAKDSGSPSQASSKSLNINISAAPVPVQITTTSLPTDQTGTAYSATLAATGGTSPYTWSILSGSLPTGLSLSAGSISGTPTVAGTSNFTVQAQDSKGQTATQALSIVISAAPVPVQITTTSLPTDQTGTAYSAALAATGGTSPYTWSILSGSLPTGLSLSAGSISGTPTVAGTSNFTVQAQDSKGQTATQALSIVISAAPVPVQITTTSLPGEPDRNGLLCCSCRNGWHLALHLVNSVWFTSDRPVAQCREHQRNTNGRRHFELHRAGAGFQGSDGHTSLEHRHLCCSCAGADHDNEPAR